MRARQRGSGSSDVICEPDVDVHATSRSPGCRAPPREERRAPSIGTPNLLMRSPVEMCGWLCASMSGLTRRATRARCRAPARSASMRSSSPGDSALIALTPSAIARSSSVGVLPTPVKTMLGRLEAGSQRHLDLADRVGVGPAAKLAQQPRDGQRRVRLERVVERVREAAQCRVQLAVADAERRPHCRRTRACRRRRRWRRAGARAPPREAESVRKMPRVFILADRGRARASLTLQKSLRYHRRTPALRSEEA